MTGTTAPILLLMPVRVCREDDEMVASTLSPADTPAASSIRIDIVGCGGNQLRVLAPWA